LSYASEQEKNCGGKNEAKTRRGRAIFTKSPHRSGGKDKRVKRGDEYYQRLPFSFRGGTKVSPALSVEENYSLRGNRSQIGDVWG